jgi:hypothetical protein
MNIIEEEELQNILDKNLTKYEKDFFMILGLNLGIVLRKKLGKNNIDIDKFIDIEKDFIKKIMKLS